jgi:hypothetical protein
MRFAEELYAMVQDFLVMERIPSAQPSCTRES